MEAAAKKVIAVSTLKPGNNKGSSGRRTPPSKTPKKQPEEDIYYNKLKRICLHRSRKWYDPPSSVVDLILLPGNNSIVLAVGEDGLITAISIRDPTLVNAEVEWFALVDVPSLIYSKTEICHAAYDAEKGRLFFTIYPMDAGVFQVDFDDIMLRKHGPDGRKTPSHPRPPPPQIPTVVIRKPGSTPRKQALGPTPSVNFSYMPVFKTPRREVDVIMKPFIPRMLLNDGLSRWFYGMAAIKNLLFICHRHRPKAISVWSTASMESGELLCEIPAPENKLIIDFQPYNCSLLLADASGVFLAVVSLNQMMLFSVKIGREFKSDLLQVLAGKAGNAKGELKFPLGLNFSAKNSSLWVADSYNDRVQVYEKVPDKATWKLAWTSASYPTTVVPVIGAIKREKPPPTWLRCVAVPTDKEGNIFAVASISDRELICIGLGGPVP